MRLPAHHRPTGGFRNPWPASTPAGFGKILRWIAWERLKGPRVAQPDRASFRTAASAIIRPRTVAGALSVTWIGHSTSMIQIDGSNVLTDPIWGERASPLSFAGPRRWVPPAVPFDELPPIDVVVLSHDHYDHLDESTVRAVVAAHPSATWCVPLGIARWLRARRVKRIFELDWWQKVRIRDLDVACTPARHFSGRRAFSRDDTLWASWCLTGSARRVYFGGDTAYHPEFRRIALTYGPFDVVLLPVGAYNPRWIMQMVHMDPDEAIQAWRDIAEALPSAEPPVFIPIHWGTFKLTDEPMDEPPRRLTMQWLRAQLPPGALRVLAHGETLAR